MDYTDIKSDWTEAHNQAYYGWGGFLREARDDLRKYLGDQWDAQKKQYLKLQGRQAFVFNRLHRNVKIVTGYERKNRLMLKIGPEGGEDDQACSQFTKLIMNLMGFKAFNVLSDAFEFGSLVTGSNLVNIFPDRKRDIQFKRNPYNKFFLDPTLTERDLSDCDFILRREMMTKDQAKRILPSAVADEVDKIQTTGRDEKFPLLPYKFKLYGKDLTAYDEFWQRDTEKRKILWDRQTGEKVVWKGQQKRLDFILANYPHITSIDEYTDTVKLHILYGGEVIWNGTDPYGIDDYPFIWIPGFFTPEEESDKLKLQSFVRVFKDPQVADNMRLSQAIDILETQVFTGIKYEEGALVNPDDAYKAGQGIPLAVHKDKMEKVQDRQGGDIPAGVFTLHQILEKLLIEIPGINQELLGTEEKDIPGILSKFRQGGALTILHDLFDNLRFAKRCLGRKLVKMIQANYSQEKVTRITNEPIAEGFYTPDFEKYDCVPVEGLLTDTQRQMAYMELQCLREKGAPIPWAAIIDAAPIQLKAQLKQYVAKAEQQQQQMTQQEAKERMTTEQAKQAKIAADLGRAKERTANVEEHKADAVLARVKTLKELEQMDWEKIMDLLDKMTALEKSSSKQGMTKR